MTGTEPTVAELLPRRDALIELVEDPTVNPVEKDFMLVDAEQDLYFGPAVAVNGLLQQFANRLHEKAYPESYKHFADHDWIDKAIGPSYDHEGAFDPVFDLSDQIIDLRHLVAKDDVISRKEIATFMRRMTSRQLHASHRAALMAESYRRHNVGVRGFYIDEDNYRIGMFSTYNIKHHFLQPKLCGERLNLETALDAGFSYCVGLVVMSLDRQIDPGSGIVTPTEPPCGVCRLDFATNPLVDGDTNITCASPNEEIEEYSVDELLQVHGCPI